MLMKLLKIPENTNDLRDHKVFINAVKELNIFNNNLQTYLKKIIDDEYLKPVEDWANIAKLEDLEKLNSLKRNYEKCFYCYKTNTFIGDYKSFIKRGWSMGEDYGTSRSFSMSDDGSKIIITDTSSYKESRFSHSPILTSTNIYIINLIEKSVKNG